MRIKESFIVLLLSCLVNVGVSQSYNLVPNPRFELGSPSRINDATFHIDLGGINNWEQADINVTIGGGCLTDCSIAGWNDFYACYTATPNVPCIQYNSYSSGVIHADGTNSGFKSGIRTMLIQQIQPKEYILRYKIFTYENNNPNTKFFLTYWTTHWNDTDPSNHKTLIADVSDPYTCDWQTIERHFIGSPYYLQNFVVQQNIGDAFIDDVEIYEYCPETLLLQNQLHYIYEPKYEAVNIKSGFNSGAPVPTGNVDIRPGGNITYKAGNSIHLLPGFNVQGGLFHGYIAPCGHECMPPTAEAGSVNNGNDLCSFSEIHNSYTIGMPASYGMTYSWAASPSSAISNLSNPSISNPIFTPPTTGFGTIVYTLTVQNPCGEMASDIIIINYNTQGALTSYFANSFTGSNGPMMGLTNSYSLSVSEIIVNVLYPSPSTTVFKSFTLKRGIDFGVTSTGEFWPYPTPNDFGCDARQYPINLYYKVYCNSTLYPCVNSCPSYFTCSPSCFKIADNIQESENIKSSQQEIRIFPNPHEGIFYVYNDDTSSKDYFLYDLMGKLILEKKNVSETKSKFDLSSESKGVYSLKIVSKNGQAIKKIIFQ